MSPVSPTLRLRPATLHHPIPLSPRPVHPPDSHPPHIKNMCSAVAPIPFPLPVSPTPTSISHIHPLRRRWSFRPLHPIPRSVCPQVARRPAPSHLSILPILPRHPSPHIPLFPPPHALTPYMDTVCLCYVNHTLHIQKWGGRGERGGGHLQGIVYMRYVWGPWENREGSWGRGALGGLFSGSLLSLGPWMLLGGLWRISWGLMGASWRVGWGRVPV